MKDLIESKLKERTTDQLKQDIKTAMSSSESGSNTIFVLGLNILEDRLTSLEYEKFEESL